MGEKIDSYEFGVTEITTHIPEHEVLISFNNDSDAPAFHTWWYKHGKESFEKWYEENPEEIF